MAFSYEYPRVALAVNCVVFGVDEGGLKNTADRKRS